jgi:DNA replicative helicase MCM subunit Mcm2 (Cdc46/Mcm family)
VENYQYLRKHVLYSKKFDPSKFSSTAAKCRLIEYYTNVMSSENSLTSPRLLDTLHNICYVVARLKLKDTIDEEDVKEVIEFYNKQGQKFKSEFIEPIESGCRCPRRITLKSLTSLEGFQHI